MNSNAFALSSASSPPLSRRYGASGGVRGGGGGGGMSATAISASSKAAMLVSKQQNAAKKMAYKKLKFHQQPLLYVSSRLLALLQRAFQKEEKIDEFESMLNELCGYQLGQQHLYRRQQELDVLCAKTRFTRNEIKALYWGWKVACPDGILDERIFKDIYAQFFPQAGDSSLYAHFVFNAMFGETIANNDGQITFCDYACALSTLCRGSIHDKIKWIFTLYDINKDGRVNYDEVLQISVAIYGLLGFNVAPAHNLKTYEDHAKRIFAKLDQDRRGYITFEQFSDICLKDETLIKSMECLVETNEI